MGTVRSSEESNPIVSDISEWIIPLEGIAKNISPVTINISKNTLSLLLKIINRVRGVSTILICILVSWRNIILSNDWMLSLLAIVNSEVSLVQCTDLSQDLLGFLEIVEFWFINCDTHADV